ncbi:UNVERIFIED_CONTAM: hypothetical protein K2H54_017411 [Gekko kuhli]
MVVHVPRDGSSAKPRLVVLSLETFYSGKTHLLLALKGENLAKYLIADPPPANVEQKENDQWLCEDAKAQNIIADTLDGNYFCRSKGLKNNDNLDMRQCSRVE